MTIRRKLQISNILMIVVPVSLILLTGILSMIFIGSHYFDSLEDMLEYDDGVYSVQSLTLSYWGDFEREPERAAVGLQTELSSMGFHLYVEKNGTHFSSNFTEEDVARVETLLNGWMLEDSSTLTLVRDGAALIRQSKDIGDASWSLTAVRLPSRNGSGASVSYLRSYLLQFLINLGSVTFGAVILTNVCLTRWVSHSILKSLRLLQEGAGRIEKGDLDTPFSDIPPDEIGEVCRDFDSMRQRLKEATQARAEYENYRKELLAGISHDLRTPLTSIKGYADGLLEGIADTEEKRQRYYRAIRLRAGDMEALADNLSSFSRLETEKLKLSLEPQSLGVFLDELLEEYSVEAEKKQIVFLNEIQDRELQLSLDVKEMKRVFRNLFENSAKYRVGMRSVIRLWDRREEGTVEIGVSDDGPGVPEEELHVIFNSFYRSDQSRTRPENGSGLGLAVAKRIVESHGGTIRAENRHGLTILLRLPVCEEGKYA